MPVRCLICGNRSTGVHYGVVSCEGCKAFYKRGLSKSLNYKCYFGRTCFDDGIAVNRCKACRFQKCVEVGMNLLAPKRGRRTKEKLCSQSGDGECVRSKTSGNSSIYHGLAGGSFRHIAPAVTTSCPTSVIAVTPKHNFSTQSQGQQLLKAENIPRISANAFWNFRKFEIDRDLREQIAASVPYIPRQNLHHMLSDENFHGLPEFLSGYWEVVQQRGFVVKTTINAVAEAVRIVFQEQFALWDSFMYDVIVFGNVPHQPQLTLNAMIETVRDSVARCFRNQCRFLHLLPGFTDLELSDQKILLTEKFSETWLIVHSPYMHNRETYYLIGQNSEIHYSQYWMGQLLQKSHLDMVFAWAEEVNNLNLTVVESFILLAVAIFQPEITTAKSKSFLAFLNAHYIDCLLHSIRTRCPLTEQTIIEQRLRKFMELFRSIYRLGNFYVRALSYTTTPFQAIRNSVPITAEEAISMENDGLPASRNPSMIHA